MKKILFALVAIAMVFVSCKKGTESKDLSIKMEITDGPTVAGVTIKCTPSDTSIYYSIACVPTDSVSKFNIDSMSAEVYAAVKEYGFDKVAMQGVYEVVYAGELEPNTKYTPIAFQIDQKERVYKTLFYGPEFTTKVLPTSSLKLGITYDGNEEVTITPDGSDNYVALVVDSALLYYWGLEDYGYISELADAALAAYAYDIDYVFSGTKTLNLSQVAYGYASMQQGDSFFVVAAPVCESHINGDKATKIFELGTTPSDVAPHAGMPRSIRRSAIRIALK